MGSKNRNRNKGQRSIQPQKQPTQNLAAGSIVKQSVAIKEPVTVETVKNSKTEAEFETKKTELFKQLTDEIETYDSMKTEAVNAAEAAESVLKELNTLCDECQKKYDSIKDKLANAQEVIADADAEAAAKRADADAYDREIRSKADKYDIETREKADQEYIKTLEKARKKAKDVLKSQTEDLEKQLRELSEKETKVAESQREAARERRRIEDEKELLAEIKEDLEQRKKRYEAASPAKITALELELTDERSKYEALHERYQKLSEKLERLQVLMDSVKTEIEDPEAGIHVASMNAIVTSLQELRSEYDRLKGVYEKYPDDAAIAVLEEKVLRTERLEQENAALEQERNRYREEVIAARNATKELEIVKQEVEATNALNEHLLQELESHKTALESRTGDTCPSLSKVDTETETDDFKADIAVRAQRQELTSLQEIVSHVKNYAGSRPEDARLFYTDNDIRAFLSGMAVSRLIILQGMSGTGKSSLPRIFAEAISGFNRLIPVESSWRDRNELLGYYNDFNKKFNAKSFTIELYRSSKKRCEEIPTFIILDEMNLARIEYYFSDFLAILQEPDHEKWLIELVSSDMRTLPMELPETVKARMQKEAPTIYSVWNKIEKSRQGDLTSEISDEEREQLTGYLEKLGRLTGAKSLIDGRKIKVTDNIWFIGTANRDESTFEISDKVYDRAQVVSLNRKGVSEGKYQTVKEKYISVSDLKKLFAVAIQSFKEKRKVIDRLNMLDQALMEHFDMSFGNRIVTQTINFTAVYCAAGGRLEDALDYQISTKILRKVITSDDEEALLELQEVVSDYPETVRLIEKRMKELR